MFDPIKRENSECLKSLILQEPFLGFETFLAACWGPVKATSQKAQCLCSGLLWRCSVPRQMVPVAPQVAGSGDVAAASQAVLSLNVAWILCAPLG